MEQRKCLLCEKSFRGRSDKKFCNDYCRNAYNNSRKTINQNEVRRINNVLSKNRKILDSLSSDTASSCVRVKGDVLTEMGFVFKYQTQVKNHKSGLNIWFCYDYYYLELYKDWYVFAKTGS